MSDAGLRVRAAPAPSGSLHVGNVRTFLYNWLHARHHGGKFILRIEDTDASRFTEGSYRAVLEDLRWLELTWDEGPEVGGPHGPYRQSERTDLHLAAARRLLESGAAYRCYCTGEELRLRREEAMAQRRKPGYDGRCYGLTAAQRGSFEAEGRPFAIRVHVPDEGRLTFEDLVIGPVTTDLDQIDDFVIVRSDGGALYHLAVVVDDALMGITHVIRGDDLLSNTPKQILLHGALGNPAPIFGHVPQVLGPDRKPLSKRHGSTSIQDFRDAGYLPEALVNYLALLGWGTADDTIMSRAELINRFTIEAAHPSPAMFDLKKLDWLNGEYIRMTTDDELTRLLTPWYIGEGLVDDPPSIDQQDKIVAATPLIKTRMRRLEEAPALVRGLFLRPAMDPATAAGTMGQDHVPQLLRRSIEELKAIEPWSKDNVEAVLRGVAQEMQLKPRTAFAPFYLAVSGSPVSAPIFDVMALLGRRECLARLTAALG